jgi:anti-sigma-K factor RskA
VLLPAGLYRIVNQSPTPAGWLSVAGFLLAPLPSALTAQPPEPRRLLLMAPFAAVIAAEGVAQLWSVQGGWRAIVARAVIVSVPLCFVVAYLSR